MKERTLLHSYKKYQLPTELASWAGLVGIAMLTWFTPLSPADRRALLILCAISAAFFLALFRWLVPRYGPRPWVNYLGTLGMVAIIAAFAYLLNPYGIHTEILYLAVVASNGIIAGRTTAFLTTILCISVQLVVAILGAGVSSYTLLVAGAHALALLFAGYAVSLLTGSAHLRVRLFDRQNRYLAMLLQAGVLASRTEDLRTTLSRIAEVISREIPVTTCRICLLIGDQLVTFGAYPIRQLKGWDPSLGISHSLSLAPVAEKVLQEGNCQVMKRDEIDVLIGKGHCQTPFFDGVQTACLIPLVTKGKPLGIIAVGEARQWHREPFDQEKLDLLQTLATQISAAIHNTQLYYEAHRQAQRLAVLNEVGRAIGSTIELDELLELIYEQLSKVIPSDTYFVSLHIPEEEALDLRILIDRGERFPRQKASPKEGLASWVLEHQQPLLVRHLSEESDSLPVRPIQIGQEEMSESWLGVPMMAGDQVLGLLAIASYAPNAFDEDDIALLSSVAAQAALAVDNAWHHAEVEEQARRDSLTGAYNHGHLLLLLGAALERGREIGAPVSLIMMDVDYFKRYNDTYGHLVGDQVLRALVQAIQAHVKSSDIVGRWGGEEFAIALPDTTPQQALAIAERIRKTMAAVRMSDENGGDIPSPTVSQGIATFPDHAQETMQLVDIADRALYQAKGLGRDHIVLHKAER